MGKQTAFTPLEKKLDTLGKFLRNVMHIIGELHHYGKRYL